MYGDTLYTNILTIQFVMNRSWLTSVDTWHSRIR